jgi:CBS domain-containing protein
VTKNERSLGLDVDSVDKAPDAVRIARIAVVDTHGCTRDGSADTITADCRGFVQLEREVERLHGELAGALREAAPIFGAPEPAAVVEPAEPAPQAVADDRPRPRVALDLSVGDVMTREVTSVRRNESLTHATALMETGGFRHLVVLDEDDEVVGVMSQRDIVYGPLAWSLGQGLHGYEAALERVSVKNVMHEDVRTVDPDTPLKAAARQMLERQIGCLPVLDGDSLVGIVTESDLLGLFV